MRLILMMAWLAACAGCSAFSGSVVREGNYLTSEHAFNDTAAESARRTAERYCADSRLVAVKTRSVCTLTTCTTDYQCMDREDAARLAPPPDVRKS